MDEYEKHKMKEKSNYQRNLKWYQVAKDAPAVTIDMAKLGVSALSTYMCLVHCSSREGACIISQSTMAKALGITSRTVRRSINKLAKHGFLAILNIGTKQNVYVVNPNLVWQKAKDDKHYVTKLLSFPVNVVTLGNNYNLRKISQSLDTARQNSSRHFNFNNVKHEKVTNNLISFKNGKKEHVKKIHEKLTKKQKKKKIIRKINRAKKQLGDLNRRRNNRRKRAKKENDEESQLKKILAEQKNNAMKLNK